jgi:hypothetical protein
VQTLGFSFAPIQGALETVPVLPGLFDRVQ